MSFEYRNYTTCIKSNDLDSIEQAITHVLEKEGCHRIPKPPQPMPEKELKLESWRLLKKMWIIGLFNGNLGWTIVKTRPHELWCRRARENSYPRLITLSTFSGCDAFHWGAYNHYGILLEANANGSMHISGSVNRIEEEATKFYEERIDKPSLRFDLLKVSADIQKAVQAISSEQRKKEEQKLQELYRLEEKEQNEIGAVLRLPNEEENNELLKKADIDKIINSSINIQSEIEKLLTGNGIRVDRKLSEILSNSKSYWKIPKNDLFYLAYTQEKQLKDNKVRLLFFQPAEYYQRLKYLSEIEGNY